MELIRWNSYSRREFHDAYEVTKPYKSGSGKWGLTGIISIPGSEGDFAFFVTLGTTISHHEFKESITRSGILTWQSQPDQKLTDPQIKKLINHDELRSNIHLLLRTSEDQESYLYFGRLKYFEHNNEQERPVRFKWQIIDWEIKVELFQGINLNLVGDDYPIVAEDDLESIARLTLSEPPPPKYRAGASVKTFNRIVKPDYALRESMNRNLGRLGEESVIEFERKRLSEMPELAAKIEHISKDKGDGAGYDIRSYELDGSPRFIEVKTTTGSEDTELYATKNELDFAEANSDFYHIYRVFEFNIADASGKLFIAKGHPSTGFTIEPRQFKLKPK